MLSRRPAWAEPGLQNPGSRTRETLGRAVSSPGAGGVNDHKLGGLTQHKSILLPSRGQSLEGISGDSAHASCGAASLLDTPGRAGGGARRVLAVSRGSCLCPHSAALSPALCLCTACSASCRPALLTPPPGVRSSPPAGVCCVCFRSRLAPGSAAPFLAEAPPPPRTIAVTSPRLVQSSPRPLRLPFLEPILFRLLSPNIAPETPWSGMTVTAKPGGQLSHRPRPLGASDVPIVPSPLHVSRPRLPGRQAAPSFFPLHRQHLRGRIRCSQRRRPQAQASRGSSSRTHSPGELAQSRCSTRLPRADDSLICFPSSDSLPNSQLLFAQLVNISTWMSNRHLRRSMSKHEPAPRSLPAPAAKFSVPSSPPLALCPLTPNSAAKPTAVFSKHIQKHFALRTASAARTPA